MAGETGDLALSLLRPSTAVPVMPQNVIATAGDGSGNVDVQFTHQAPKTVTSYRVVSSAGPSVQVAANGLASQTIRLSGLTNGVVQTFTVQAINGGGSSLVSAASNAVTPTALPASALPGTRGIEAWYSAGQMTGYADGAVVPTLPDFSGNRYDAQQGVTSSVNQPGTWKASWSNGKPAIQFNGDKQRYHTLASGLIMGMRGPALTAYVLYSVAAAPNSLGGSICRIISAESPSTQIITFGVGFAISTGVANTAGVGSVIDPSSINGGVTENASGLTGLNTPIAAVVTKPGSARFNGTDLNLKLRSPRNLADLRYANLTIGNATVAASRVPQDGAWTFGHLFDSSGNRGLQGHIAEIIIYSVAHTPAEIASMEAYLATRK
jgi:hypothetical protein